MTNKSEIMKRYWREVKAISKNNNIAISQARGIYRISVKELPERVVSERTGLFKRVRKQITYNSKYSISVRVIVINGKQSQTELRQVLQAFLFSNPKLSNLPFITQGFEEEEIDNQEDQNLIHGKIYIETKIRGTVNKIAI